MRFKQVGNKEDLIAVVIRNKDTTQINAGTPVCLLMDGQGVDVVQVATSATANTATSAYFLRYGVALTNIAVNAYGEAIVFGFVNTLAIMLQSRVSSSNVWTAQGALSIGQALTVDTVNNIFLTNTPVSYASNSTAATPSLLLTAPWALVAQTLAAFASSASATSDTRTAITATINAFVRMM